MKTKIKFLATMLMGIMLSTNVWGEDASYTITFATGSGDGTSVSTSTACSDIVSAGATYLSGNLVTATKVYGSGGSGLKLGTSSDQGTIKMNLSDAGKVTPTSIVVRAKRYSSSKATKIALNGKATQDISADFANYTFDVTTAITYLEIVSSKGTSGGAYAWIESITVNYESAPKVATTVTLSELGAQRSVSGEFYVGDSYTLPTCTVPCEGKVFVGWATAAIPTEVDEATYSAAGSQVTLAASNTFYAVYAKEVQGPDVEKTLTTSFSEPSSDWTVEQSEGTSYWKIFENDYINSPSFDLSKLTGVTIKMGYFSNSNAQLSIATNGGTVWTTRVPYSNNEGTSYTLPEEEVEVPALSGNGYLVFTCSNGVTDKGLRISQITIKYMGPSIDYEKYSTSPTEKYTITWKNQDNVLRIDADVASGTLLTPPAYGDISCGDTFVGWTETPVYEAGQGKPADLFNGQKAATKTTSYYAVFATKVIK